MFCPRPRTARPRIADHCSTPLSSALPFSRGLPPPRWPASPARSRRLAKALGMDRTELLLTLAKDVNFGVDLDRTRVPYGRCRVLFVKPLDGKSLPCNDAAGDELQADDTVESLLAGEPRDRVFIRVELPALAGGE